jgi:MSHA biogenesis protein MshN
MSIINQMLRDLDARREQPNSTPLQPASGKASSKRNGFYPVAAGLFTILLGALSWFVLRPAPEISQAMLPVPVHRLVEAAQQTPAIHSPLPAPVVEALPQVRPLPTASKPLLVPHAEPDLAAAGEKPELQGAIKLIATNLEADTRQWPDEAEQARRQGDSPLAIKRYRQPLMHEPALEEDSLALAALLRDRGETESALAVLEGAYAQRAQPRIAVAAGRLLAEKGRDSDALSWLERGQGDLRPADFALMGMVYTRLQQHGLAVKAYQTALKAEPRQGGWLLGLGLALDASGQPDAARVAFRDALEHGVFKAEVLKFLQDKAARSVK